MAAGAGNVAMMHRAGAYLPPAHIGILQSGALACEACPRAQCRCTAPLCHCEAHSHYRRCVDCAHGAHTSGAISVQSAYAFGDWPPNRLRHLLSGPVH